MHSHALDSTVRGARRSAVQRSAPSTPRLHAAMHCKRLTRTAEAQHAQRLSKPAPCRGGLERLLAFTLLLMHEQVVAFQPTGLNHRAGYQESASLEISAPNNGILLLDHVNMNHEAGRHDLVRAFYFDLLRCSPDPRKANNLQVGKNTLWANVGINQFHLSEGVRAQVLDGCVELAYPTLDAVRHRLSDPPAILSQSAFGWTDNADHILLQDPWGSKFRLYTDSAACDPRGVQPGDASEGLAMTRLTLNVPETTCLDGIVRFYQHVFCCPGVVRDDCAVISMANGQELRFQLDGGARPLDEPGLNEDGLALNNGIHLSLYVEHLTSAFERAQQLGCIYVNHRFNRRAYTLEEAVDQCMFRVLDVVDPMPPDSGPILKLEHEVRSCTNADGSKYKSCPFDKVPE